MKRESRGRNLSIRTPWEVDVPGLRIGLIGLGRHGMRYAQHMRELAPRATLVAVCRRDALQGAAFADTHGLRFHNDFRALIADPHVDAVVVVTPPSLTSVICGEAIRANKPLLIEKPLAMSGAVARTMAEAAESARVPLMTAQTLRFDSTIQALAGTISKADTCRHVALTYHLELASTAREESVEAIGRDMLYQIGTHLFDLIRFLTHDEIAEVRCDMDLAGQGAADSRAIVSLQTTRNVSCLLDVARIGTQRVSRIEWTGEQVQISADWVHRRLRRIGPPAGTHEWTVPPCHTVIETIRAFIGALEQGDPMPITGWDGYHAVAIADACAASATTGKTVQVAGR